MLMRFVRIRAANSLKRNHPEFWQQISKGRAEQSFKLLEQWTRFLEQARRQRLDPEAAASTFVVSASQQYS